MKIEIGKKYKSNVCYRAGPRQADNSQELFYEEWEIMFKLPDGKFLGRYISEDGDTRWREFDSDGNNGYTRGNYGRKLVPHTTTVTKYVVVWLSEGAQDYCSGVCSTREEAVEWRNTFPRRAGNVATLTYEVED